MQPVPGIACQRGGQRVEPKRARAQSAARGSAARCAPRPTEISTTPLTKLAEPAALKCRSIKPKRAPSATCSSTRGYDAPACASAVATKMISRHDSQSAPAQPGSTPRPSRTPRSEARNVHPGQRAGAADTARLTQRCAPQCPRAVGRVPTARAQTRHRRTCSGCSRRWAAAMPCTRCLGSAACAAGAKRTFSSGRRLAYFQFSSREVGRPCVSSACSALRLSLQADDARGQRRSRRSRAPGRCGWPERRAHFVLTPPRRRPSRSRASPAPAPDVRSPLRAILPRTSTCTKSGTMYSSRRW